MEEHIAWLAKICKMSPQWAEHRIYGALAMMVYHEVVARYAEQKGLFVIAQSGDPVRIRNA